MRQVVLLAHEVPTDPDISLDNLPGAGRLDLVARCVTSAFLVSHDIREDVIMWMVVQDALTLRFDGAELQGLNPDERSTAALVRRGVAAAAEAVGHQPVESTPGISVTRRGLEALLDGPLAGLSLIQLHEAGAPMSELGVPNEPVFVLSDHRSFTDSETACLEDRGATQIRLSPRPLHADQAITVAHTYLDTDGFTAF